MANSVLKPRTAPCEAANSASASSRFALPYKSPTVESPWSSAIDRDIELNAFLIMPYDVSL